jgi:hypothetical protein
MRRRSRSQEAFAAAEKNHTLITSDHKARDQRIERAATHRGSGPAPQAGTNTSSERDHKRGKVDHENHKHESAFYTGARSLL